MSTPTASTTVDAARTRRSLVAGTVGNFVEWYEFGAYGFFATVIAANFFSSTSTSDAESLIKTMVTCAVSVVALLTLRGDDYRRELRD